MKRWLLSAVCLFLAMMPFCQSSAQNMVYRVPPPNDTSLNNARQEIPHRHRVHHRKLHYKLHQYSCNYRHRHRHHNVHAHYHRKPSLYLYYSLPGTACCGENWQLRKTKCCAEYGTWSSSPYGTFEPAPEDFIYSATNDDDRHYDPYRNDPIDDTIENPG